MLTPRPRFRLLGPLDVEIDGRAVVLTGRQRALCAVLLLHANHVVSVDRLVQCLWDDRPPGAGAARVRALVAEVRRALGPVGTELLTTRRPGYVLHVGPGELDLPVFERLIREASRAASDGDWRTARRSGEQALALWRDEPLTDLPEVAVREAERQRLAELHLVAREAVTEAGIETGRHREAIAELLRLTAAHPLRERPHGLLMRALHQDGRSAEALELYTALRRRMVDELGMEPSADLRDLHQRLLRDGGSTSAGAPPQRSAPASERPVPRQLPPTPRRFVGRDPELDRLDSCLRSSEPLALIVGPAGVGKSALALNWAHRVADRFPDGQLFLDMRGFDNAEPMTPGEALPLLLQGLGCAPRDIPLGAEAQTALYRTLLADRRVLVVLDDVAEASYVRRLLPASAGSLTLVTSRDKLSGLVTLDGAYRVSCDVLDSAAALELISGAVGAEAVAADPEAAARLVELCDHLPLALCVAGSWIGDRPGSIRAYVRDLADRGRLARLHVEGEESVAVRAALDLSYGALPAEARRAFRSLGVLPGTGRSVPAAAAAAGTDEHRLADLLRLAQRVHLLRDVEHGRPAWHDLVHEYARDRTAAEDSSEERTAAVTRVLDHYLQSVVNAAAAAGLYVMRTRPPAVEGSTPREFAGAEEAYAWFDREWDDIAAAIGHAAEHGPAPYVWWLVDALQDLFHHRRPLSDWMRLASLAREVAARGGDEVGEASMCLSLGSARWRNGDLRGALTEYEEAEGLARRAGWTYGEAGSLQGKGVTLKLLGELRRALPCYDRALALYRTLDNVRNVEIMLINTASLNLALGRLDAAEEAACAALDLIGDTVHHNRAMALVNLALVQQKQARFDEAAAALRSCFLVSRDSGSTYTEAVALEALGRVRADAGQDDRALLAYEDALAVSRRVENRNCQVDSLVGLASVKLRAGRTEESAEHLDAAFEIAERTGHRAGLVEVLLARADLARAQGRPADALDHLERAERLAADGNPLTLPRVHLTTALTLLDSDPEPGTDAGTTPAPDAPARARDAATLAADLARDSGQRLLHARATAALARAHEAHGDAGPAHEAGTEATALYATLGVRRPPGASAPHRPTPHHRHRELPADAESRLTLYLTEHFEG
ncbi:AfsR/SARP family transcriptional regulator [Streptomyces rishiriensis]|uniref:DNA-binding SARP family transcriptional activator/tetratricopeptide (TPR) repeat protein n=1 Tax=Streptomyces rishiriensis TaxID=68264 RepID=A0ABU0NVR4_STRRH|nr:BTAD domain-containing putative transcriptional regulator [Streptomyces rishiriensis]MDQ0583251.1 DNA-binding SARP family transcriptional activator/tetratricopeptide (TPR) repeat protein [Streptomyces rishiriensis]